MIRILCFVIAIASGAVSANDRDKVEAVLDTLHQSASTASYQAYFDTFAPNAVFIGTDATENWSISEFKAYAKPYFDKGQGWTYEPRERHVYFSQAGNVAWFDELLDNASYGETRGTGVLENVNGEWKITQYHLTIPIPNALAKQFAETIQSQPH